MATVEVIMPTKKVGRISEEITQHQIRVAAYVRVSTEEEEQQSSFQAQTEYYTRYIQSKPEWEFVRIYSDEGISGLNTKNRVGFNQMVEDALNGDIDLILTKSISRFARNTVDTLSTIRKLKEKGVEVYFEKENIYTFDSKGELILTIMSSLAQEESRSISENVTWGKRRRMARGEVSMTYGKFLGYEKGPDGKPQINEEQAEIVRRIFNLYLNGESANVIARTLNRSNIPTPTGKYGRWQARTVMSILRNERYKGEALLQKYYVEDFLTKKNKRNKGELKQYYVRESHPAIIDPATFDRVQEELEKRTGKNTRLGRRSNSIFSDKVYCAHCGKRCTRKQWCRWRAKLSAKRRDRVSAIGVQKSLQGGRASCPPQKRATP